MDKRIIAIEVQHKDAVQFAARLLDFFCKQSDKCSILVFKTSNLPDMQIEDAYSSAFTEVVFPDSIDNIAKRKNFIIDYVKAKNFKGFLHIIEDTIVLDKDPFDYIAQIENAMDVFDYSIHFSTVADPCNYVFSKFNPRLSLDIDDDGIKARLSLPSTVSFTSHSNTCWLIYNFNKLQDNIQKFDERFSIAMYMIIEYLARRRASKKDGQLYYMNQYLSISSELGTYHNEDIQSDQIDPTVMQNEDAIFKSMNVDFTPDNNIDTVLNDFYAFICR